MSALKEIKQGRGLRCVIERTSGAKLDDGLGMGGEMMLDGLALEGTHDTKTNSAADPAAYLHEDKEAKHGIALQIQGPSNGAENGRKVTGQFVMVNCFTQCSQTGFRKSALRGSKERSTLSAAGAVRNVIRSESVEKPVDFGKGPFLP